MAKKNRHRRRFGMRIHRSSYHSYDRAYIRTKGVKSKSPVDYDNDPPTEGDDAVSLRPYSNNLGPEELEELQAWGELVGHKNIAKTLGDKLK